MLNTLMVWLFNCIQMVIKLDNRNFLPCIMECIYVKEKIIKFPPLSSLLSDQQHSDLDGQTD